MVEMIAPAVLWARCTESEAADERRKDRARARKRYATTEAIAADPDGDARRTYALRGVEAEFVAWAADCRELDALSELEFERCLNAARRRGAELRAVQAIALGFLSQPLPELRGGAGRGCHVVPAERAAAKLEAARVKRRRELESERSRLENERARLKSAALDAARAGRVQAARRLEHEAAAAGELAAVVRRNLERLNAGAGPRGLRTPAR